ncbi:hypothetical protein [Micromonospora sp. HM5-17]|uniref:VG15 protein n=1 Tax=Micromonospora sp. HM5-17 TaxID=2487710 RepID=UPI000F4620C6|nr:hypothetical protein [Micromonospora sp. HM5-17]ROT29859.1 hypothetical protein EF879_18685 [Micromonospora sp. HM5-17]
MAETDRLALEHYRMRRRLADAVARAARREWRRLAVADLSGSWDALLPRLLVVLAGAQRAAAAMADGYLDRVLAAQEVDAAAEGAVVASALAGVASDGRELASLLREPVITAKSAIGRGATPVRALATGYAHLDMIVRTQVADAGRAADQVALVARRAASGYVRMVVGATCARCIILAGRWYAWNRGFQRHPRCDCVHIPAREDRADEVRTDPRALFNTMSREEQDRVFTRAGAQAIRDGADISQVVNARRGMSTAAGQAGRRRLVRDEMGLYTTREGTTRRGYAGQLLGAQRGGRAVRLMPESIYELAGGSRDEAIRLLRVHGYLI